MHMLGRRLLRRPARRHGLYPAAGPPQGPAYHQSLRKPPLFVIVRQPSGSDSACAFPRRRDRSSVSVRIRRGVRRGNRASFPVEWHGCCRGEGSILIMKRGGTGGSFLRNPGRKMAGCREMGGRAVGRANTCRLDAGPQRSARFRIRMPPVATIIPVTGIRGFE